MSKQVAKQIRKSLYLLFGGIGLSWLLSNGIVAQARDNAYIACLLDVPSVTWQSTVIYSGDETERLWWSSNSAVTTEMMESIEKYNNDYAQTSAIIMDLNAGGNGLGSSDVLVGSDGSGTAMRYNSSGTWSYNQSYELELQDTAEKNVTQNASEYPASLTFPPTGKSADDADVNRAYEVGTTLTSDLSEALIYLNDNQSYAIYGADAIDYYLQMTAALICVPESGYGGSSGGTKTIINAAGQKYTVSKDVRTGICTITYVGKGGISGYEDVYGAAEDAPSTPRTFRYKMQKGYAPNSDGTYITTFSDNGAANHLYEKYIEYNEDGTLKENTLDDVEWVTWGQLVWEGTWLYQRGVTTENYADLYRMDTSEKAIVALVRDLLNGLRAKLGCSDITELVFNEGTRETSMYTYGIFPASWNQNVNLYYIAITAMSLAILGIIFVVMITRSGLATALPGSKASLMNGTRNILISLFLISCGFPVMYLAMQLNLLIVDVFVKLRGASSMNAIAVFTSGSGTLAALIMQFAYLVLVIYINVFYYLRGITTSILIPAYPVCMIGIGFGKKGQDIAMMWGREFLANVFIQSVHAFVYSFLLKTAGSVRGLETFVIVASIIPITKLFRTMLLGNGGGIVDRLAGGITGSAGRMAGSAVASTASAAGSLVGGASQALGYGVFGGGKTSTGDYVGSNGGFGPGGTNPTLDMRRDRLWGKTSAFGGELKAGTASMEARLANNQNTLLAREGLPGVTPAGKLGATVKGVGMGLAENALMGNHIGNAITSLGGMVEAGLGAGMAVAMAEDSGSGSAMVAQGLGQASRATSMSANALGNLTNDVSSNVASARVSAESGVNTNVWNALKSTEWYQNNMNGAPGNKRNLETKFGNGTLSARCMGTNQRASFNESTRELSVSTRVSDARTMARMDAEYRAFQRDPGSSRYTSYTRSEAGDGSVTYTKSQTVQPGRNVFINNQDHMYAVVTPNVDVNAKVAHDYREMRDNRAPQSGPRRNR